MSERNRATSSPATSQRRRSVRSRTLRSRRSSSQRRADHLDELPTRAAAHAQLERGPDLLRLHARERERGELEIVGVDELESACADGLLHRHAEDAFGGAVRPAHLRGLVDHQDRVGERGRDRGQRHRCRVARCVRHPVAGATRVGTPRIRRHWPSSSTGRPGRLSDLRHSWASASWLPARAARSPQSTARRRARAPSRSTGRSSAGTGVPRPRRRGVPSRSTT